MNVFYKRKGLLFFLLPGLLGIVLFYFLPFVAGAFLSFTNAGGELQFVGLQNYVHIWRHPLFLLGFQNSVIFSILCAPLAWVLGFLLAQMLHAKIRKADGIRKSILIPYIMPSSTIMLIWLLLFAFGGSINRIVVAFGGSPLLFLSNATIRIPIVVLFVWRNLGYVTLVFLGAMQSVPSALYEYAKLEGANFIQRALFVTLPSILPTCFLLLILTWVNSLKIFRELYFLGGNYPPQEIYSLQNYMINSIRQMQYQNSLAAAYSFAVVIMLFFSVLFIVQEKVLKSIEGEVLY